MNVDKFIRETLANKIEEAVEEIRKTILHPDNEPNVTLYPKTSIDQVEQLAEQLDYIKTNLIKDTLIGTDGIVIDKAADSEKIEVSGKNLRQALKTEVGQWKVYLSRGGDPNDFLWAGTNVLDDECVVVRGNNGCIYTNMPDAGFMKDTTVPNKKYVDDNFINKPKPKKVDSLIGIHADGGIYVKQMDDMGSVPFTVAQYFNNFDGYKKPYSDGVLLTNVPVKPYQCANKKYVDDAIASIASTIQTKYQHNLVLEGTKLGSTFKAFMSIPRSDNTTLGTLDEIIAALGDAYISCTGYIYDGNQKSYNIIAFNTAGPGFEYNDPETGGQVFAVGNDDVAITDNPIEF